MPDQPTTDVKAELAAMRRIVAVLESVDQAARDRIAGWVFDRYRDLGDDRETTDA